MNEPQIGPPTLPTYEGAFASVAFHRAQIFRLFSSSETKSSHWEDVWDDEIVKSELSLAFATGMRYAKILMSALAVNWMQARILRPQKAY